MISLSKKRLSELPLEEQQFLEDIYQLGVSIDCRFEPNLGTITAIIDHKKFSIKDLCLAGLTPNFQLPTSLANLTNLEKLLLGFNLDEAPDYLVKLKKLKELGFTALKIIPDWIRSFPKIEVLDFNEEKFNLIPESIGKSKKLRIIGVGRTNLNSLPQSISQLTNLEELILDHNQFTIIPQSVGFIPKLKRLNMYENPLKVPFNEMLDKYMTPSTVSVMEKDMVNFKEELQAIYSNLDESSFKE
jgi:Leucine-rich repeat (LRR) protein